MQVFLQQPGQAGHVGVDVGGGQITLGDGALQHRGAGEQHALLLDQQALAVVRLAGGVQQLEGEPAQAVRLTVRQAQVRRAGHAQDAGAGGALQGAGRRFLFPGPGEHDGGQHAVAGFQQRVQVVPALDHRVHHQGLLTGAHQVAVKARAAVVRPGVQGQARYVIAERHPQARLQARLGVAFGIRVELAHLIVGRAARLDIHHLVALARGPRLRRESLRPAVAGVGQHLVRGGELRQLAQHAHRRRGELATALAAVLQRVLRTDPDMVDGLITVVGGHLVRRRHGSEEAGIEPARRPRRRHPVIQIGDAVQRQRQPVGAAQIPQIRLTTAHRPAAVHHRMAAVQPLAGAVAGQQHAGLLEALTHGGDQITQPAALRQAQQGAGGIVIVAIKVTTAGQVAIAVVDGAAGEHIKAGHEHGLKGALEHQDFKALLGVPKQRQR